MIVCIVIIDKDFYLCKNSYVFFYLSEYSVFSLTCYINPLPYILNFSVTVDNNKLIDISGECIFTIIWLRNPESSMIIFGYNQILNKNNLS